jgi:hypothetical protein
VEILFASVPNESRIELSAELKVQIGLKLGGSVLQSLERMREREREEREKRGKLVPQTESFL